MIITLLILNLLIALGIAAGIKKLLDFLVCIKSAKRVNEVAISFTGKSVKELTNKTAHYSYDATHAPNGENDFWAIYYDCRKCDLQIEGKIPKANFWSITAYDKYSRPLPSYLIDTMIKVDMSGKYKVFLSTKKKNRENEMDVSPSPVGEVVVRVSMMDKSLDREAFTPFLQELKK